MKGKITKGITIFNVILFFAIVFFSFFGTSGLFSLFGKQFSIPFYLSIIALPLFYFCYFFVYGNRCVDILIKTIMSLFCVLFVASLGMAFILKPISKTLYSETPTKVVIVNAVKYAYDLAMIPYFSFFAGTIKKDWIKRFVFFFLVVWTMFGCFQVLCYALNSSTLWAIYDSLDVLKIVGGNSEMFRRIRLNYGSFRFFGFASEPSMNALLFSVFLTPFLTKKILFDRNGKRASKAFYVVIGFFSMLFLYLTKSASVYFTFLAEVVFLILLGKHSKKINKSIWFSIIGGLLGVLILLMCIPESRYVLIDRFLFKIIDINDASTQHRYSTIWNDLMVLSKFPLFGVGDGNQGFFYAQNVAGTWMSRNLETQAAIKGEMGLVSGGAAIPSFISGFGIFGLIALAITIKKLFSITRADSLIRPSIKVYYLGGLFTLLFALMVSNGFHREYLVQLFLSSYFFIARIGDNKKDWLDSIMIRHDLANAFCERMDI